MPRPLAQYLAVLTFVLGLPLAGCNSGGTTVRTDAGVDRFDAPPDVVQDSGVDKAPGIDARDAGLPDVVGGPDIDYDAAPCQPKYTSCSGLCGNVLDVCTGETFECGGCGAGLACDPALHECITPKATCSALGAQCGRIRNTCGTVLDCGTCPAGQECDADTNLCVACTLPAGTGDACQAMGIACGKAWLGCGPNTSANRTDCGACPAGYVCNDLFNTCEPQPVASGGACTPLTKAQACTDKGNQCAIVSDGCGGSVDCGVCPTGQECGIRGVANRCSVPPASAECARQGRECGAATDVCGTTMACGSCAEGYLCNTAGQCKAKCTPAKCGHVQCGWNIPDGCGGTLSCYLCWENETDRQCGPLTDGQGLCCAAPKASDLPSGWTCGTVTNACGVLNVTCPGGQGCNPTTHKCCTLPDKSLLTPPAVCGQVSNSCGTVTISCAAGEACKSGQCCALPTQPTDGTCGNISNTCGSVWYGCSNGQDCVNGKCKNTCWGTYPGKCGVKLADGVGGTIDCPCSGTGNICSVTQAGATGTCSCPTQKSCADYVNRCGALDNGCGGTVNCGCTKPHDTCGGDGEPGVCGCKRKDCTGTCGVIDDGCGGTLTCAAC